MTARMALILIMIALWIALFLKRCLAKYGNVYNQLKKNQRGGRVPLVQKRSSKHKIAASRHALLISAVVLSLVLSACTVTQPQPTISAPPTASPTAIIESHEASMATPDPHRPKLVIHRLPEGGVCLLDTVLLPDRELDLPSTVMVHRIGTPCLGLQDFKRIKESLGIGGEIDDSSNERISCASNNVDLSMEKKTGSLI